MSGVAPALTSPTSTIALTGLTPSSSYHELPGLASPVARKLSTPQEGKEQGDGISTASSAVQIEYQSERQQLTYRIQNASIRAHLSLTRPTEGKVAGVITEPTPEQVASLLTTSETLKTDIHLASSEQLAKRYNTDLVRGLSTAKVAALQVQYGANVLTPPSSRSYLLLFLDQLIAGFSVILWIAAIMIMLSWQPLGAIGGATPQVVNLGVSIVIIIVILVSAAFNFYQEVRAAAIVKAFASIVPTVAHVIREGREVEVLAAELVPGDLVNLRMGDKVPADVRLLSVDGLQLNNSALTGESEPINCTTTSTSLNYLESHNLGFYSALIVQGRGTGLVSAVGDSTVLGAVSQLTQTGNSADTNLHREIRRFVLFITVAALFTGTLAFIMWGAWLYHTYPIYMPVASIVTNAFSLIVAYVPEGLPVCVTLTLTMVARRMYKQKVLVKSLPIIEAFNSVSIVCSDKTGTLTMNQMTVEQVMWTSSGITAATQSSDNSSFSNVTKWSPPTADVSDSDRQKGSEWTMAQRSFGSNSVARQLFVGAMLCNVAEPQIATDGTTSLSGDAADVALYNLLRNKLAVHVAGQQQVTPRLAMQPFNSATKLMITLHSTADGTALCHMKGAPEIVLDRCSNIAEQQADGSSLVVPLTASKRSSILGLQDQCGRDGYRLIGMCKQEWSTADGNSRSFEDLSDPKRLPAIGYTFLGLFALLDPPRPAVVDSVRRAHAAGIRVSMVTGDHPSTAQAIAAKVGIVSSESEAAGVRRVKLGVDELGRAVCQMTVKGKVIETHVLGTSGRGLGEINPTASPPSRPTSNSVSVAVNDQQQPSAEAVAAVPQRASAWTSWWQRNFALSYSTLINRSHSSPHACVLTGSDVAAFDDYMWSWALQHRELVFARTSPEHKLRIVQELQRRGEVVAVTGDGTNDAPALKRADCGVAMQAGAEVAREAADMVLLDNNFSSIIEAISQGRLVHDNLKKVALYLLPGGSWSEMWPVMVPSQRSYSTCRICHFNVFLGVPLALSSFYMIIICVLTDVVNALAIVQEKPEAALMTRPPANQHTSHLIDWRFLWHAYLEIGTICSFSAWFNYVRYFQSQGIDVSDTFFAWSWGSESCCPSSISAQCLLDDAGNCYSSGGRIYSNDELVEINSTGQSIFFVSLLITNFFNMYSTRTRYTSLFRHNPFYGPGRNLWLIAAALTGSLVAIALTQIGWFNDVFLTRPVAVTDVAPAIGFGVALFVFDETRKWVVRHHPSSLWAKTAW